MSLRSNALVILALLSLGACSFEPLHAKKQASGTQLNAGVKIDRIEGREGQLLRIHLEDQLNPGGVIPPKPSYRLTASFSHTITPIDVSRDGTVSRYNMYLVSDYVLYRNSDNQPVARGTLRNVSSYNNLTNAYFSTFVAEDDALKDGIRELGELYRQRLSSYLSQPDAGQNVVAPPAKPRERIDLPDPKNSVYPYRQVQ